MRNTNEMEIIFDSKSINEGFARVAVASFMSQLNPTLEEVADVKTAVSEAVTNAIVHGCLNDEKKRVNFNLYYDDVNVYMGFSPSDNSWDKFENTKPFI